MDLRSHGPWSASRISYRIINDAEEKGFIMPGKVRGGRLGLWPQHLMLALLPCDGGCSVQNSHGELLFLFSVGYKIAMCLIKEKDALGEPSSPGKCGSIFFLLQDHLFMIKTLRISEVQYQPTLFCLGAQPWVSGRTSCITDDAAWASVSLSWVRSTEPSYLDWQEHSSWDGKKYYYNKRTKQSGWEKPACRVDDTFRGICAWRNVHWPEREAWDAGRCA